VVLNCRSSVESGEQVLREIRQFSPKSILLPADVSKKEEVQRLIDEIVNLFQRIDVLVNNAGILKGAEFLRVQTEDVNEMFEVNVLGSLYCLQQAAAQMIKQGYGSVINVTSISQFSPFFNSVPYALSKSALQMLTRCAALDLSKHNIRVNSLIPGIIKTDIDHGYRDEAFMERMRKIIPLGRVGEPLDMVGAALFLASDLSAYVTGIDILVDGGFMLFKDKNPQ
jgi:NAD(P)-dependent dehydrogenase (short-subunit alcohol dehydrogenase family)